MLFLDYIYKICCDFYKKRERDIFKISGLILQAVIFLLNIQLISFLLEEFNIIKGLVHDYRYYIVGFSFPFLLLILYIRYFRITNYDEINNKFYSLSSSKRKFTYICSLLYVLISFISTIGIVFYKGGHINGWW